MLVTFLIVNYNMRGLTERCIESIYEQKLPEYISFEILLADNSNDAEFMMTKEFVDRHTLIKYQRIEKNRGWRDAVNRIVPQAKGDIFILVHPDVTLSENALTNLVQFMEGSKQIGVASGSIIYPDGTPYHIRLSLPTLSSACASLVNVITYALTKRRWLTEGKIWDHTGDVSSESILSVCLAVRRDVIEAIGPLPTELTFYYINDYICNMARKHGYLNYYTSQSKIVHYQRFSDKKLYSDSGQMKYKNTATHVMKNMEKDKYSFYRHIHSSIKILLFKTIDISLYLVYIIASAVRQKNLCTDEAASHWQTIKSICSA